MTTNDLGLLQLGEDRAQRGHLIGCGERYREFEMSREPAIAGSQLLGDLVMRADDGIGVEHPIRHRGNADACCRF